MFQVLSPPVVHGSFQCTYHLRRDLLPRLTGSTLIWHPKAAVISEEAGTSLELEAVYHTISQTDNMGVQL